MLLVALVGVVGVVGVVVVVVLLLLCICILQRPCHCECLELALRACPVVVFSSSCDTAAVLIVLFCGSRRGGEGEGDGRGRHALVEVNLPPVHGTGVHILLHERQAIAAAGPAQLLLCGTCHHVASVGSTLRSFCLCFHVISLVLLLVLFLMLVVV